MYVEGPHLAPREYIHALYYSVCVKLRFVFYGFNNRELGPKHQLLRFQNRVTIHNSTVNGVVSKLFLGIYVDDVFCLGSNPDVYHGFLTHSPRKAQSLSINILIPS